MNDPLLPFLLVLALIDLALVQATGAVGITPMAPLWLLALAAPILRRLQRFAVYRALWNGGVLVVFATLVHHATTTGLLHLLEDGLLLAVLCQVHLLNNVGERQRPDLVFFNSFLVTFVTSFFAPDLTWSLLFALHTFVLLPGLSLQALTRRGRLLPPGVLRALLHDSVPRAVAVGVVTAVLFVLLPRDFQRRGWIEQSTQLSEQIAPGVSDCIRIDDERPTVGGDEVIARFEIVAGDAGRLPPHWRGATFADFDGRAWFPQRDSRGAALLPSDPAWERAPDGAFLRNDRSGRGNPLVVRVRQFDPRSRQLLVPLGATRLAPRTTAGLLLEPGVAGVFGALRLPDAPGGPFDYDVDIEPSSPRAPDAARSTAMFTRLPESGVPRLVYDLAQQLAAALPPGVDRLAIATACADWLQHNRRYQLPGEPGFARNLADFLVGAGAGHCEYFATALALLLRVQGVPCRLVGGYLVHERIEPAGPLLARARDAHAWVEVLGDDRRWHTFDATPAAEVRPAADRSASWWRSTIDDLEALWGRVASFDAAGRAALLAAVVALPATAPWSCLAVVATAASLLYLRRRRGVCPGLADYRRALRAARLRPHPGETPRELLLRATRAGLRAALLARLVAATSVHERLRYRPAGGD